MKLFIASFLLFIFSNTSHDSIMQDPISTKIQTLLSQEDQISDERKKELEFLAKEIHSQMKETGFSKATFVCTHNSRRSQLAQIWFWRALEHFELDNISSYSGGTEATAFNHRMVSALQRFGFDIQALDETKNSKYVVRSGKAKEREMVLFSKKYADSFNPQQDFIAVMVCSQADKACPFVPGAFSRVALPYEDPKVADDTPLEAKSYDDKVVEIGREVLYLVKRVNDYL